MKGGQWLVHSEWQGGGFKEGNTFHNTKHNKWQFTWTGYFSGTKWKTIGSLSPLVLEFDCPSSFPMLGEHKQPRARRISFGCWQSPGVLGWTPSVAFCSLGDVSSSPTRWWCFGDWRIGSSDAHRSRALVDRVRRCCWLSGRADGIWLWSVEGAGWRGTSFVWSLVARLQSFSRWSPSRDVGRGFRFFLGM